VSGLRSLFRKEQVDRELDQELRAYLEMAVDEKIKQGISRKDRCFGRCDWSEEAWKFPRKQSRCRLGIFCGTLWEEFALQLADATKESGFTVVAVLTLAVGIGATTGSSRSSKACCCALFRSRMPTARSVRRSFGRSAGHVRPGSRDCNVHKCGPNIFESGCYITASFELSEAHSRNKIDAARLNSRMFLTLGVEPVLGRVFTQQER